jgi:hypothetical protein
MCNLITYTYLGYSGKVSLDLTENGVATYEEVLISP